MGLWRKRTPVARLGLYGLVLLVLGVGALDSSLHFVTVPHSICLEHGSIEEGPPRADPGPGLDGAVLGPERAASGKDPHEVCAGIAALRKLFDLPAVVGHDAPLATTEGAPTADPEPVAVSFPLYLLAPSHSPPAS